MRRVFDSPRQRARNCSGPTMSIASIWLIAAARCRRAEDRVVRRARRASTSLPAPFGLARARPVRTASAAEQASKTSLVPWARRSNRSGRFNLDHRVPGHRPARHAPTCAPSRSGRSRACSRPSPSSPTPWRDHRDSPHRPLPKLRQAPPTTTRHDSIVPKDRSPRTPRGTQPSRRRPPGRTAWRGRPPDAPPGTTAKAPPHRATWADRPRLSRLSREPTATPRRSAASTPAPGRHPARARPCLWRSRPPPAR